jgi:hypothetical protein
MHLFRSEEHLRNWTGYDAEKEGGIIPILDLMKVFSANMFRTRLDPAFVTKSKGDHSMIEALAEVGKIDPYWVAPEWASAMGLVEAGGDDLPLSIDSSLGTLLANEGGKAILEKHIPGISTSPDWEQAKGASLKTVPPMTQGLVTDDMLNAIAGELSKL